MNHLTLLLLLFTFINVNSQSKFYSEGLEVTKSDIEQTVFSKDSTANALIIYEIGNSYVDKETFKLNTTIKRKLKILNRNGFERGELSIFIYDNNKGGREKVKDIKATVYNLENGKITKTKLKKTAIFEEDYNDNISIIKVAFPNIKEGSVINYSYTLESPFMFKYKSWNFQDNIPKLYSEYNASIPGNWEYNIKLVGGHKLTTNYSNIENNCLEVPGGGSANCAIYRYVMKDIPAFIEEDYMTTKDNYLARIEYELKVFRNFNGGRDNITKTWKSTDKEIERDTDLGRQLKKTSAVKGLLNESITSEANTLNKAKKILEYVQNEYAWNEEFRIFENVSIKDLIKNKSGNVGEINSLLYNLLVSQGIEAKPVLLSTRRNGFITQLYPVLSDFNYMIVKAHINGKAYLLDATDDYLYFGQIPFRCLNMYGRLMDFDNGSEWYDINAEGFSIKEYRYELDLNENAALTGSVNYNATGYHALNDRKRYFNNTEAYADAYINSYESIDFLDFEIIGSEKTSNDFNSKFNIKTTCETVGNSIYLNPYLFTFFKENPFKLQERSYPIDFGYKDTFTYRIKINVDESYQIKELPESVNIGLPNKKGSFTTMASQEGNSIVIYFKLTFKDSIYYPNYYDSLKTILSKVVDAQKNSLIVLEKKQ